MERKRSRCAFPVVTLVALFAATSSPTPVQARLDKTSAADFTAGFCEELARTRQPLRAVAIEGAPGLKILGTELADRPTEYARLVRTRPDAFQRHELVSSARYARLVAAPRGETVLMVPQIGSKSIPGFDGVILDARGKPKCNYSLKTVLSASAEHAPLLRAGIGIEKAAKFSAPERWLVALRLLREDSHGRLTVSDELTEEGTRDAREWLRRAMLLFGVTDSEAAPRPTRIVVDIKSDVDLPNEVDVARMRKWIAESDGLIESIVFLKGDRILEIAQQG